MSKEPTAAPSPMQLDETTDEKPTTSSSTSDEGLSFGGIYDGDSFDTDNEGAGDGGEEINSGDVSIAKRAYLCISLHACMAASLIASLL